MEGNADVCFLPTAKDSPTHMCHLLLNNMQTIDIVIFLCMYDQSGALQFVQKSLHLSITALSLFGQTTQPRWLVSSHQSPTS